MHSWLSATASTQIFCITIAMTIMGCIESTRPARRGPPDLVCRRAAFVAPLRTKRSMRPRGALATQRHERFDVVAPMYVAHGDMQASLSGDVPACLPVCAASPGGAIKTQIACVMLHANAETSTNGVSGKRVTAGCARQASEVCKATRGGIQLASGTASCPMQPCPVSAPDLKLTVQACSRAAAAC